MAISKGNSKVPWPNVSLPPVLSCGNCKGCRTDCYALKFYRMYKEVKNSWDSNWHILATEPGTYWTMIDIYLKRYKPRFFRWHVSGDIVNQDYLHSMKQLARLHPNTRFLAFTKMYALNYSNIPKNLNIVFSAWPGTKMPRKPFPVAYMQDGTETRVPNDARECPGSCENCGMCWSLRNGESVVFHKH